MFCIYYKGKEEFFHGYFIGFTTDGVGTKGGMFTTDKTDKRIKKYKTRKGCERALNEIIKNSKNQQAETIEIVEI